MFVLDKPLNPKPQTLNPIRRPTASRVLEESLFAEGGAADVGPSEEAGSVQGPRGLAWLSRM